MPQISSLKSKLLTFTSLDKESVCKLNMSRLCLVTFYTPPDGNVSPSDAGMALMGHKHVPEVGRGAAAQTPGSWTNMAAGQIDEIDG
jgi:hypothetical protein